MAFLHKHRLGGFISGRHQPADGVEIDRTHPLAYGMVFCVVSSPRSGPYDLTKRNRTLSTQPSWSAGAYGLRSSTYVYSNVTTTDLDFTSGNWAVGAFGNLGAISGTSSNALFGRASYTSESVNSGWSIGVGSSGNWRCFCFANNGSANYQLDGTVASTGDVFLGMSNNGTARRFYANGAQIATTGLNLNPATSTGTVKDEAAGGGLWNGAYMLVAWNRDVPSDQWAWLNAEPYSFLRPSRIAIRRTPAFNMAALTTRNVIQIWDR